MSRIHGNSEHRCTSAEWAACYHAAEKPYLGGGIGKHARAIVRAARELAGKCVHCNMILLYHSDGGNKCLFGPTEFELDTSEMDLG